MNHSQLVNSIFTNVADHYDLMNNIMSIGIHKLWRREFVNKLPVCKNNNIVDMAGGTGDIAILMQKIYKNFDIKITVCDPNEAMMNQGKAKLIETKIIEQLQNNQDPRGWHQKIDWHKGFAEKTSFDSEHFDLYTTAFSIRNFTDRKLALKEALRIIKPKGWFYCLEFSQVEGFFKTIYKNYLLKVIPKIGKIYNAQAYNYLANSIKNFLSADEFLQEIQQTGFINCGYVRQMQGVTAIHWGQKK